MELYKSSYRVIKAQWGIAIDITGEITSLENYHDKESCRRINEGLWLRILNPLTCEEDKYVYMGLESISESIRLISPYKLDTLIIFHNIEYNICDYQPEGLVPAIYKWVSDSLKIETPKIETNFNRQLNKYEFNSSNL